MSAPTTTSRRVPPDSSWRGRGADVVSVVAITLGLGVLSQRWTGLDTPDSSFYLTLGLNGDAVTDRALEPHYAWTRLGVILPMRILADRLGTFAGLEVYRLLLLFTCVAGAYLALRRVTERKPAALFTAVIMLNTVILSYLGNPYLTRTVLAGTFLILAVAASMFVRMGQLRAPTRRAAASYGACAGAIIGWLFMTNPYGALLAGSLWLIVSAVASLRSRMPLLTVLLGLITGALSSVLTWGVLLGAGWLAFPKLGWFDTYRSWLGTLDQSDFASPEPVWLEDISLLALLAIVVVTIVAWLIQRRHVAAQAGLLLSVTTVLLAFALAPTMGGVTLESPMYQAMLWPSMLLAVALSAVSAVGSPRLSWSVALVGLAALIAVAAAGRWPGSFTFSTGVAVAIAVTAACCLLWAWAARRRTKSPDSSNAAGIAAVTGLAILLVGAQLLQNSRRDLGLYYLSPYANAYLANPIETKVRTAVNAQDFVLQNTTPGDRIQLWVGGDWAGGDRELYVVAGMQMWGPNIATLQPILDETKTAELRTARPSVIEMVAPTVPQILQFWASLPHDANPSAPNCYDFTWPSEQVTTGHLCLSDLNWSQTS